MSVRCCFRLAPLQSVLDLQISIRLEHPETIATGIHRRQLGLRLALFHFKVGEDEEDKPADRKSGAW